MFTGDWSLPVKEAEVDLVVETRNPVHVGEIVQALGAGGFPTRLLSSMAVDCMISFTRPGSSTPGSCTKI